MDVRAMSWQYEGSTVYRNAIDRDVNVINKLSFQKNINSVFPVTEISLRVRLTTSVHNFSFFELKIVTNYPQNTTSGKNWLPKEKRHINAIFVGSKQHTRIVVGFKKKSTKPFCQFVSNNVVQSLFNDLHFQTSILPSILLDVKTIGANTRLQS